MKIEITDSELSFLENGATCETDVPIRIIKEARIKVNLMKAMPRLELMSKWRSLNFIGEHNRAGYVLLDGGWQIDLRSIPDDEPQKIKVVAIRRIQ